MVVTNEGFQEVVIESWPEWDLNPRHWIPFRCSNLSLYIVTLYAFLFENITKYKLNYKTFKRWVYIYDIYVYSSYIIGFDSRSKNSLPDGSVGTDLIIFGVDMS